ncbi:MAG: CRTAC1 family protein [Bacteroidales bacterium]
MRTKYNSDILTGKLILVLLAIFFYSNYTCPVTFRNSIRFEDVAQKSGINFQYTFGDDSYVNIVESSGSGVTVFDFNNDGFMDILFLNGTYLEGISDPEGEKYKSFTSHLYRNNGDGTFADVTKKSGIDFPRWAMAAAPVDIDNDGDQDLFMLNYGPNVFYRNNGNGTFTDITSSLGLTGPDTLNGFVKWSIGATFWDYNNDGRLDVMVGNFLAFDPLYQTPGKPDIMPHPSEYKGQASMLYEQLPDGHFKDVTREKGLYYPDSKCMGLTVYDYDDDGDPDIFQANDHQLNFMFRNDGGKYTEVGILIGVASNSKGIGSGSMHGSPGDFNGDGLLDLFVPDLEHGALYMNIGKGLFRDATVSSGLAAHLDKKGTWGSLFFDFDNDGDQDIIAANGTGEELILQYPLLLENDGKGYFKNKGKSYGTYFSTKRSGRGMAVVDYDNDGDMDIVVSHLDNNGTPALLRNNGGNKNHWLGINIEGNHGQGPATGATVRIYSEGEKFIFANQWSTSYLSNNDPRLHAGIGKHEKIDKIEVCWSDGSREEFYYTGIDKYITLKQGQGIKIK